MRFRKPTYLPKQWGLLRRDGKLAINLCSHEMTSGLLFLGLGRKILDLGLSTARHLSFKHACQSECSKIAFRHDFIKVMIFQSMLLLVKRNYANQFTYKEWSALHWLAVPAIIAFLLQRTLVAFWLIFSALLVTGAFIWPLEDILIILDHILSNFLPGF